VIRKIPRPMLPSVLPCGCRVKKPAPRSKLQVQVARGDNNLLFCACGRQWVAVTAIHEITGRRASG
jgi:hypothetical protein